MSLVISSIVQIPLIALDVSILSFQRALFLLDIACSRRSLDAQPPVIARRAFTPLYSHIYAAPAGGGMWSPSSRCRPYWGGITVSTFLSAAGSLFTA